MDQNELISIIVPIYNVEKYIARCLDSIIAQTYKNIEIVIIDDGSSDNSLSLCNEYAEKDSRITVIHQENAGVILARSKGVEISRGSYLGFVDADDWIEPDMYEVLMNAVHSHSAPMAVINYVKDNDVNIHKAYGSRNSSPCTGRDAFLTMISDGVIGGHMCTKLIKNDLFNGLAVHAGVAVFEDMMVSADLFEKCDKVVYVDYHCYHYFVRSESATHTFKESSWTGEIADHYIWNKTTTLCPDKINTANALCIDHNMYRATLLSTDKKLTSDAYQRIGADVKKYINTSALLSLKLGTKIKFLMFSFGIPCFNAWVNVLLVRRKIRGFIKNSLKLKL